MPLPQGCQRVEDETEGEQAARSRGAWTQNPAPERPGPRISPDPQQGEPPAFWEPGQLPLTTPPQHLQSGYHPSPSIPSLEAEGGFLIASPWLGGDPTRLLNEGT